MAVRLAQASSDERGTYQGGSAGNQNGYELNIRAWYNRPWDTVIRAKNETLAKNIAGVMEILINCKKIGYDQSQRLTLYEECEKIGWDISKINKISNCECDCSSLIAVVLRFCRVSIPKTVYTGNLASACMSTGYFGILRNSKYLTSDAYLKRGDIVLNTAKHVSIALDNGSNIGISTLEPVLKETIKPVATPVSKTVNYAAQVKVSDFLNVRTGPDKSYPVLKAGIKDCVLPNGIVIAIVEEQNGWGRVSNIKGWVSLEYVIRLQ